MANNSKVISTVVKLDGVEAVQKSLQALGKAGAAAFKSIRDAADKISPGLGGKLDSAVAKLKAGFKQLQDNAKNVGNQFGKLRVATTRLGGEFLGVAKRIGVIGGAIVGAGAAFIAFTKNAADNADAVGKQADALGLSVKSFQGLEFAANQANISSEDFGSGFAKLSKLIGDGLSGDKAAIKKLQDLGIAYKNASGKLVVPKTNQEAFLRFADTIAAIEDPAKRASVAAEGLGKSYAKFIPLLLQGSKGIKDTADQFSKTGLGFTDAETKQADAFGDALDFLFKTIGRLRDKAFLKFAEPLTKAFGQATDFIIANADRILASVGNLAAQVAPVFSDIVNALFGNDKDVKNTWIIALRDGIIQFGKDAYDAIFTVVIPAFNSLIAVANTVAGYVNSIFGTEISGKALLIATAIASVTGVFGVLAAAITAASAAFGVLSAVLGPLFVVLGAVIGLPAGVVAAIVAAIAAAVILIYAYWDEIVAYANQAWEIIKAGASVAWNAIVGIVSTAAGGIASVWEGVVSGIKGLWGAAMDFITGSIGTVKSAIQGIISYISSAITKVKALVSASKTNGSDGGGGGFARGGRVYGPGTSTSDSIPARLSKGEFVIRAAAVRRYGAQLFAALNGMRLSPNTLGRFAMGGLVGFPSVPMTALPAGAGGPVSTLNLTIDGVTYSGLSGPVETIKTLERNAAARRLRATGRPSPYGR